MVGARSRRGSWALALAAVGGAVLVVSAAESWVQPARVAWPSYVDGVPDSLSHPSDAVLRLGAAALGSAALVLVALARRGLRHPLPYPLLAAFGAAGLALGVAGLDAAAGVRGFGSVVANDMTLDGFHHGLLNYVELAGASLLCLSPLAAVRASPSRR